MAWDGQLSFASLARTAQHADRAIAACQEWLADNYREANPIAAVVLRSGLPERSFKRRFRAATGLAPIEYVQNLRLEKTKQILETTDLSVEEVAAAVGYSDGTFFRRLFRRRVGLSPAAYRRRFRPIARPGLASQTRNGALRTSGARHRRRDGLRPRPALCLRLIGLGCAADRNGG